MPAQPNTKSSRFGVAAAAAGTTEAAAGGGDDDETSTNFRKRKQQELRQGATSQHNWNTLFIRV